MSDCGLVTMETWEELNPDEKDELDSLFSGHLHDLVVCSVLPILDVHTKASVTQRRKDGVALPRALLPMLPTIRRFQVNIFHHLLFFSDLLSSQR